MPRSTTKKAPAKKTRTIKHKIDAAPREDEFSARHWWLVDLGAQPPLTQGASPLVRRCMSTYGWDESYARRVLTGYRQLLTIKKDHQDWTAELLSPSLAVDQMWHQHILAVNDYLHDCMLLCGHVIGHDPDGMHHGREERREATREALLESFAESEIDIEIWKEVFADDSEVEDLGTRTVGEKQVDIGHGQEQPGRLSKKGAHTTVLVTTESKEVITFVVHDNSPMSNVLDAMARKLDVPCHSLRFCLNGERIDPDSTPLSLELQDMEEIKCLFEQSGC